MSGSDGDARLAGKAQGSPRASKQTLATERRLFGREKPPCFPQVLRGTRTAARLDGSELWGRALKTVHTIGYEGSRLEAFIHTLLINDIDHLIDVRDRPISRKPGFSKNSLRTALYKAGIAYTHLQSLGDPKPGRDAMRQGRYEDFLHIYTEHLDRDSAQIGLSEAVEIAKRSNSVLMCFERAYQTCHRSLVADRMATLESFAAIHLQVALLVQGCSNVSKAGLSTGG